MNSTVITPLFVAVFTSAIILLGALLIEKDPSLFSLYKRNIKNTQ